MAKDKAVELAGIIKRKLNNITVFLTYKEPDIDRALRTVNRLENYLSGYLDAAQHNEEGGDGRE